MPPMTMTQNSHTAVAEETESQSVRLAPAVAVGQPVAPLFRERSEGGREGGAPYFLAAAEATAIAQREECSLALPSRPRNG